MGRHDDNSTQAMQREDWSSLLLLQLVNSTAQRSSTHVPQPLGSWRWSRAVPDMPCVAYAWYLCTPFMS